MPNRAYRVFVKWGVSNPQGRRSNPAFAVNNIPNDQTVFQKYWLWRVGNPPYWK